MLLKSKKAVHVVAWARSIPGREPKVRISVCAQLWHCAREGADFERSHFVLSTFEAFLFSLDCQESRLEEPRGKDAACESIGAAKRSSAALLWPLEENTVVLSLVLKCEVPANVSRKKGKKKWQKVLEAVQGAMISWLNGVKCRVSMCEVFVARQACRGRPWRALPWAGEQVL